MQNWFNHYGINIKYRKIMLSLPRYVYSFFCHHLYTYTKYFYEIASQVRFYSRRRFRRKYGLSGAAPSTMLTGLCCLGNTNITGTLLSLNLRFWVVVFQTEFERRRPAQIYRCSSRTDWIKSSSWKIKRAIWKRKYCFCLIVC